MKVGVVTCTLEEPLAGSLMCVGLLESVDNEYVTPSTMMLTEEGPEVEPLDCMKERLVSK